MMVNNILTQHIKHHFSNTPDLFPDDEINSEDIGYLQHQELFLVAISEYFQLITLTCVLVSNSIRMLGIYMPILDGATKHEIRMLTKEVVGFINQFYSLIDFFISPRKQKPIDSTLPDYISTSIIHIKHTTSILLAKSGLNNWLKNVDFHTRKSAIQTLAFSFRSQIIRSNQRFLENNLIKKGGL